MIGIPGPNEQAVLRENTAPYADTSELTAEEIAYFLECMNSGMECVGGSKLHRLMVAASERALRITSRMNSQFESLSATRALLAELTGRDVPESVGLFPPFSTDCGLNIHFGEGVFVNAGCKFQDQGGIYLGDGVLIGHNTVIATLNHNMSPSKRANTIPSPVRIETGAWIGSGCTILPGVTIGEGAVCAAGAVVAHDVEAFTVVGGVPAKFIKHVEG